jgi:hypothetical protein
LVNSLFKMILRLSLRLQNLSRHFRGTDTWIKDRSRHKQATDRNRLTQYRLSKVLMMIFIRPIWTGIFSYRSCVGTGSLPSAAERPQEIAKAQNSISLHSNIFNTILINFYYSPIYPHYLFFSLSLFLSTKFI